MLRLRRLLWGPMWILSHGAADRPISRRGDGGGAAAAATNNQQRRAGRRALTLSLTQSFSLAVSRFRKPNFYLIS